MNYKIEDHLIRFAARTLARTIERRCAPAAEGAAQVGRMLLAFGVGVAVSAPLAWLAGNVLGAL